MTKTAATQPARLLITDNITQRYARSRAVVYSTAAVCVALFIAITAGVRPSFPVFLTASVLFTIGSVACIMRNPLGMLTLRAHLRLFAREFIFDSTGFTVIRIGGEAEHFDRAQAKIFFMPGPGGHDYFLQVRAKDGKTGSFYIGNDKREIEPLALLLEQNGALAKWEKEPSATDAPVARHDQFFR